MSNAKIGEQLVGAFHKLINECEVVSYNQFSERAGDQMEVDVLAIKTNEGHQQVYVCEVVTHLDGINYGGSPSDDYWNEFGSTAYQGTLDTIYQKFIVDHDYVTRVFDNADEYQFQLWSPYVAEGYLTSGLDQLVERFEQEYGEEIDLKINGTYTEDIEKLRSRAGQETKQRGESAYRLLQILEHMRR
ncbi:hypothetical protein GRS48_06560 [Halorubrum sp. JWXQ-INN 858]|uniref:hypothetical protein n=1 Tax=Halorubrum sp. JWXQ-INN 858 TaxID=2690782 RepID=UPI00135A4E6D|nr:hypothetical protein [Halorubrum sp. JWXQ-INN 858]MWV64486.1 hypothetical protein [Halorubrum sp. JWXQ-INN 858]